MNKKKAFSSLIIPTLVCLFNALLIMYPQDVLAAAREGLGLWFNNVLPSLLPFMVGVNLLNSLGFVCFLGALLSPVMRTFFNVPGAGGFALIAGLASGYPMGAKVVAQLKDEGRLTPTEAQRLVGFCNNAGPLFIVGVAGTSLFGCAAAGYCLWVSHVAAALTTGFLLRFYHMEKKSVTARTLPRRNRSALRQAFDDFRIYRHRHAVSFGQALGDGVKNAMESNLLIGGFIILFCVIVRILQITGFFSAAQILIPGEPALTGGMLAGILEITNGVKLLASSANTGITRTSLVAAATIISFGGFSIHAQALFFLRDVNINTLTYLASKALNAILAGMYCALLYPLFAPRMAYSVPASRMTAGIFSTQWQQAFIICAAVLIIWPTATYAVTRLFFYARTRRSMDID